MSMAMAIVFLHLRYPRLSITLFYLHVDEDEGVVTGDGMDGTGLRVSIRTYIHKCKHTDTPITDQSA